MSSNLFNLPNEILLEIFSYIKDEKSLLFVCKKFYKLMTFLNEFNISLNIKSDALINPSFNFDELLSESSTLDVIYNNGEKDKRFDEKIKLFLETYGSKVIRYCHKRPTPLNITKFIKLMPNLNTLEIDGALTALPVFNEIPKNSISLKKLKILSFKNLHWKTLEIFNVEEFKLEYSSSRVKNLDHSFIFNWTNFRKFSVKCVMEYPDLMNVVSKKKLESLAFIFYQFKEDKIKKFLATQKQLKELKVHDINGNILSFICDNFVNLEKLNLKFVQNLRPENFSRISNLKNLKTLSINQKLDENSIDQLSKFSLPKLEFLSIGIEFYVNEEKFQKVAKNFPILKSFDIEISTENYHKIFTEILLHFNKVEKLSVRTNRQFPLIFNENKLDENFYTTQHSNPNLKTLNMFIYLFDSEKLKEKLLRDFPNLEEFPENYQFSSLNKISSFSVDLNSSENVNEMLKNCSVQFNEQENWVKAVKDGKKEIKFDLQKYFDDQQLKSTLNSSRKLKSISLSLGSDDNETILTNYINYLRAIGENVTELTISSNYYTKLFKIKRVIESFSKLEIINFNQISLESGKKQIFKVNNEKIKKVILNFHVDRTGEISDIEDSHNSFCNNFRFSNNTLEYFKINVTGDWYLNDLTFEKASTRKFLKNQNKLTEKKEGHELDCEWQDRFVFEAWSK